MLVLNFLRQYPIPTAGLSLSLFALGNLVQDYSHGARLLLGGVAFLLYLPYLLKLLVLNARLKEPLENPVAASVLPTFTMATLLLAGYVKPYAPEAGTAVWYAGLVGHALLILWFSWMFLKGFALKKVFPSWFIVYMGIAVASASAPVTGRLDIGRMAFWFAFVSYFCLLPFVCWRLWKVGQVPDAARPTAVILAAPASMLLVGYMVSFEVKEPLLVWLLLVLSLFFYGVGVSYLLRLCRTSFTPGHAAFTFPLVISALTVQMTAGYTGLAWMAVLGHVQTAIAVLVVLWVLGGYLKFLFPK